MSFTATTSLETPKGLLQLWWPVLLGLLILYVPTYLTLARNVWTRDAYAHGPIILCMVLWLLWQARAILSAPPENTNTWGGAALLTFGLLLYILGRSQEIIIFEVGSQIPVLGGTLLILLGSKAFRSMRFALLFIVFLIPLPVSVIDTLTGPLKQQVSIIVDQLLYSAGYPIARSGVVLTIGSYQLLIADACSGLNSMYALTALGLFFMHLRGHASRLHNGLLLASIVPIAFVANVGRVIALVLITYYLGDEAGEGFLHDFAGVVEFVAALGCLLLLDGVLSAVSRRKAGTAT